jgi:hypothetical protein
MPTHDHRNNTADQHEQAHGQLADWVTDGEYRRNEDGQYKERSHRTKAMIKVRPQP